MTAQPLEFRMAQMESDMAELKGAYHQIDKRLDDLRSDMNANFSQVHGRMDKLDERLTGQIDKLDQRLTGHIAKLDEKLTGQTENLDERVTGRLDKADGRFDGLDRKIERLDRKIDTRFTWMIGIQMTSWLTVILALVFKH